MNARFRKRATGNVTARIGASTDETTGNLTRRETGNVRAIFRTRTQGGSA